MLTTKNLELLGFVFLKKDGNKDIFINRCLLNRDEKIYFGEIYEDKRYIAIENNCGQFYFMGWLKNIKELKKILEQIGISSVVSGNKSKPLLSTVFLSPTEFYKKQFSDDANLIEGFQNTPFFSFTAMVQFTELYVTYLRSVQL